MSSFCLELIYFSLLFYFDLSHIPASYRLCYLPAWNRAASKLSASVRRVWFGIGGNLNQMLNLSLSFQICGWWDEGRRKYEFMCSFCVFNFSRKPLKMAQIAIFCPLCVINHITNCLEMFFLRGWWLQKGYGLNRVNQLSYQKLRKFQLLELL